LPGLLTLTLSTGLWVLTLDDPMRFFWVNTPAMMLFLPWTLALPVIGAAGALISRRLGGRPRECLMAGLFPFAMMCALFILVAPGDLLNDMHIFSRTILLNDIVVAMLAWVIIPGVASLVGALPVAISRRHESAPSNLQA
jgi:hypothetical protein